MLLIARGRDELIFRDDGQHEWLAGLEDLAGRSLLDVGRPSALDLLGELDEICVLVRHRDPTQAALRLDDVDHAPVREVRHHHLSELVE